MNNIWGSTSTLLKNKFKVLSLVLASGMLPVGRTSSGHISGNVAGGAAVPNANVTVTDPRRVFPHGDD